MILAPSCFAQNCSLTSSTWSSAIFASYSCRESFGFAADCGLLRRLDFLSFPWPMISPSNNVLAEISRGLHDRSRKLRNLPALFDHIHGQPETQHVVFVSQLQFAKHDLPRRRRQILDLRLPRADLSRFARLRIVYRPDGLFEIPDHGICESPRRLIAQSREVDLMRQSLLADVHQMGPDDAADAFQIGGNLREPDHLPAFVLRVLHLGQQADIVKN